MLFQEPDLVLEAVPNSSKTMTYSVRSKFYIEKSEQEFAEKCRIFHIQSQKDKFFFDSIDTVTIMLNKKWTSCIRKQNLNRRNLLAGAAALTLVTACGKPASSPKVIPNPRIKWQMITSWPQSLDVIFLLGFFIDFFEVAFILMPIFAPVAESLGLDLVWYGVVIGANLQTSFLTPPFGFALFFLRGVAPPEVTTQDIYRGAIPFICVQLIILALIIIFPSTVTFLPSILS